MLDAILEKLGSRIPTQRQEGIRAAKALPPEDLLELLQRNSAAYRRRSYLKWLVMLPLIALPWIALFYTVMLPRPLPHWLGYLCMCLMMNSFVSLAEAEYICNRFAPDTRARKSIMKSLEGKQDAGFVAPVLALLADEQRLIVRHDATLLFQVLEYLIPRLRLEDVEKWTPEQRKAFLWPLLVVENNVYGHSFRPKRTFSLAMLILKALEQLGDERDIGIVKKLAQKIVFSKRGKALKAAAQECLPYLQLRADKNTQGSTLLRASDGSASAQKEILLRPALPSNVTPPDQLLRPHDLSE